MPENDEMTEHRAEPSNGIAPVVEPARSDDGFILRDGRYGEGGGVPGVDPNDWMSIKHLVRGAGG